MKKPDPHEIVHEGMSRAPVVTILALEIAAFAWLGWEILGQARVERSELRARNTELTRQLVDCHERKMAPMSSQIDIKP